MVEVYDYDVASMEFSYVDGPFEVCDFDSISIGDEVGIVVGDEFLCHAGFCESRQIMFSNGIRSH